MKSSRISWEIVAIVLTGCSLRLYGLDTESLWRDEVSSVNVARFELQQIITNRSADVHPPLYYFLLHYWIALWGSSEFAVRFLSLIFGSIAIWPMYKIGTLLFNHHVGLLSALGLALSEFQIQYSQEAKGYSLLGLLTLLSFVSLIQLLRQQGRFTTTRYVLLTTLLMYTHIYALFVVVSQNLYYFFAIWWLQLKTISVRRWLLLQGFLFLAYLPWAGILLRQIRTVREGFWLKQPTSLSLVDTFASYAGSRFSLVLFLVLVLVAGIVKTKEKYNRLRREDWGSFLAHLFHAPKLDHGGSLSLLVIWLFTPVLVPFLLSLWVAPIYLTRGTIGAGLAFQVMIARGMEILSTGRALSAGIIGIVLVVSLVNVTQYYGKVRKEQWRDVAVYVDGHATAHAVLLFSPSFCQDPFDYYSHRNDLIRRALVDAVTAEEGMGEEYRVGFAREEQVWLIACNERRAGVEEKQTLLSDHLAMVKQQYKGITLLGFLRKEQ